MISSTRILAILVKELKQLARDRITFGMVVMLPLLQLLLFGFAINTDVRHVPSALVDLDNSSYSRRAALAFEATQAVTFIQRYSSVLEAEAAITRGEVRAALVLPSDFNRRLIAYDRAGQHPQDAQRSPIRAVGQWLVDGSDTLVARAITQLQSMPLDEILGRHARQPRSSFEAVLYFNPEQRTPVNTVPGLLAVILTMTMILFTGSAIVREHEQGNMEFLITTPVRPIELMLGKIIPYIGVGLIQTAIILGLGYFVFQVPLRGGLLALLVATLLFISASLVLGLIISTIARTQLQAMQMTVFVLLPSILLSGFMFPYEAMPAAAQMIAEALPATHFMRSIRGVVLRGAETAELLPDLVWLAAFTAIGMSIAALRFKKRLD